MGASKAKVEGLIKELQQLVNRLSPDNAVMALTTFKQLTQILVYRQKRLGKTVLKRNMVKQAWELLAHYHDKCFRFKCEGDLAVNLNEIPEAEAVSYYGTKVVGLVNDVLGQRITIGDVALVHLYKDGDGNHTMRSEFYQPTRGKRLPWIRHVLTNSNSIYRTLESMPSGERRLIYGARVIIPLKDSKEGVEYFVVIVRRDKNGNLHFLTAYPVFEERGFLEVIESTEPYER